MTFLDDIVFVPCEGGYRTSVRTPLPAITWREPRTDDEKRLAYIMAHGYLPGVPPYTPGESQPARIGGSEA